MTKKLRRGYTTGTCAQAATKAAVTMLLGNVSVDQVTVSLPGKEVLTLKIAEAQKEFNKYNKSNPDIESVSCACLLYTSSEKHVLPDRCVLRMLAIS